MKPEGKLVQFMSHVVCECSTMARIDPQHLSWTLENIIKQFRGLFEKIICIEIPSEPNSCSAAELRLIAKKYCCITDTANSIQEALIKLTDKKRKKIIFFGSLYGVSAALSIN